MFATAAVVMVATVVTYCDSLSASEFEKSFVACGLSPNENFESGTDARINEFPWNVQIFYTLGEKIACGSP